MGPLSLASPHMLTSTDTRTPDLPNLIFWGTVLPGQPKTRVSLPYRALKLINKHARACGIPCPSAFRNSADASPSST